MVQEYLPYPPLSSLEIVKDKLWLDAFEKELKYVRSLFAAMDMWITDFSSSNWLVSRLSSRPTLHLIDQAPAPIASGHNEIFEERYYEREDAVKKYGNDPALLTLKKMYGL